MFGLPLKLMQSRRKLYHLIGYKLQYGCGHNVVTMTYDDVTNHVFRPLQLDIKGLSDSVTCSENWSKAEISILDYENSEPGDISFLLRKLTIHAYNKLYAKILLWQVFCSICS